MTDFGPLDNSPVDYPLDRIVSALIDQAIDYPLDPIESAVVQEVLNFTMATLKLLRLAPGSANPAVVDDASLVDTALLPSIGGDSTSNPVRRVHTDGFATSLQVGGGPNLDTVQVGTAKATGDLQLQARGATIPFSEAASSTLANFLATSIVGAINEARAASMSLATNFANGEVTPLLEGEAVYQDTANPERVLRAIASSNAANSRVLGFVTSGIAASPGQGRVTSSGRARVRLEASLSPTLGQEVFLSASVAGRCTNVQPAAANSVISVVGYITNLLTYNGTSDLLVEVQMFSRPKPAVQTWNATFGASGLAVGQALVANGTALDAPLAGGAVGSGHPVPFAGRITKIGFTLQNGAGNTINFGIYINTVLVATFNNGGLGSDSAVPNTIVSIPTNLSMEIRRESGGVDPGGSLLSVFVEPLTTQ